MRGSTVRTVAGLVAVGAIAIGGCTATADGDGPSPEPSTRPALPLDAYLTVIYGEGDLSEGQEWHRAARMEELVAACMVGQGFEYRPVTPPRTGPDAAVAGSFDLPPGSLEFAEQYGYGISTAREATGPPDPDAAGSDPNLPRYNAMTPEQRRPYLVALLGEEGAQAELDFQATGVVSETSVDPGAPGTGCRGEAYQDIYTAGEDVAGQFSALEREVEAVTQAIRSDPRLAEAEADWSACMADAGHPGLDRPGDAEEPFREQVSQLWAAADADAGSAAGAADDGSSEAEGAAALPGRLADRLAELRRTEIDVAVADRTCRERTRVDGVRRDVAYEHQSDFVEAHRAELDAWAAAAQKGTDEG